MEEKNPQINGFIEEKTVTPPGIKFLNVFPIFFMIFLNFPLFFMFFSLKFVFLPEKRLGSFQDECPKSDPNSKSIPFDFL